MQAIAAPRPALATRAVARRSSLRVQVRAAWGVQAIHNSATHNVPGWGSFRCSCGCSLRPPPSGCASQFRLSSTPRHVVARAPADALSLQPLPPPPPAPVTDPCAGGLDLHWREAVGPGGVGGPQGEACGCLYHRVKRHPRLMAVAAADACHASPPVPACSPQVAEVGGQRILLAEVDGAVKAVSNK